MAPGVTAADRLRRSKIRYELDSVAQRCDYLFGTHVSDLLDIRLFFAPFFFEEYSFVLI